MEAVGTGRSCILLLIVAALVQVFVMRKSTMRQLGGAFCVSFSGSFIFEILTFE
jgi:hypothetical protein